MNRHAKGVQKYLLSRAITVSKIVSGKKSFPLIYSDTHNFYLDL